MCMALSSSNEELNIVDNKPKSRNGVLEISMEISISVIQSNLNNLPLHYSRDSYFMNRKRRSDTSKATNMMRQEFFLP